MKSGTQPEVLSFGSSVLIKYVQNLNKCIQQVQQRKNIEDIHDLRVVSRRVRTVFSIFNGFLPAKKYKAWEKPIRDLTKVFSKARDLDVQISLIKNLSDQQINSKTKPGIRRLIIRLKQKRKRMQPKLQSILEDFKKEAILQDMLSTLESFVLVEQPQHINPDLFQLAFDNIHKCLDEFLFYEIYIPYPERIKELHLMRIAAKKMRYTIEIFAPLYDGKLDFTLEVARLAQTKLGEIRDCDVWLQYLPNFLGKENKKVVNYFGNPRPFKRLVPGVEMLLTNRRLERERLYLAFLENWRKWRQEEVWVKLRQIIFEPVMMTPASSPQ